MDVNGRGRSGASEASRRAHQLAARARRKKRALQALALAAILAGVFVLVIWAPVWLVGEQSRSLEGGERARQITEERRNVLGLLAAVGAAGGLYYSHLRSQLDRDSNWTDRYTKAVELLSRDRVDARLGGIYALGRVATDSVRDRSAVSAVLSTYVRVHASGTPDPSSDASAPAYQTGHSQPVAVLAALDVLGARPFNDASYPPADLSHADLQYWRVDGAPGLVNFAGAKLDYAKLTDARVSGVSFVGASFVHTELTHTHLPGCVFSGADMTGADLSKGFLDFAPLDGVRAIGAFLTNADLHGAHLRAADLSGVHGPGANLEDADLTYANLTGAYLARANLSSATLVGANLTGANLSDADLSRADLAGANLSDAILTGSKLVNLSAASRSALAGAGWVPTENTAELATDEPPTN